MKKLLLFFILLSTISIQAQFNQNAPWMENLNAEQAKSSNPTKFKDAVEAFNTYWETRNPNVKGSGFKPFKRWENYWKNFVKEDGTLPTSAELWNTWISTQQNNARKVDLSSWQPIGPFSHINTGSWASGQGRVNAIIVDPNNSNTYYAGAPAGGIWKSTDAGSTWAVLSDHLPQIGVSGIAIDYNNSNIIYIATGDDDAGDSYSVGVMKSTNGGTTWTTTGLNTSNSPSSMNEIYMHPANSNMLWVATNNGVYKTINGGTNWSNLNGTSGLNIKDIKIKPGSPNTIYAVTSNTLYISTDAGENFTNSGVGSGLPLSSRRIVLGTTLDNTNAVYILSAATNNGFQGIYKSTNSGVSFTQVSNLASVGDIFDGSGQAWYDLAFTVSSSNEDEFYVGVLNIWKTSNGGTSFTKLNSWNGPSQAAYTHADIHLLRFFNNELFAGTDGGFYKSTNGGTAFTDLTAGMQISQFYKIAVAHNDSQKMVGGLQDNGGHAYNNNIWQNYHGGDGMEAAIDPNNTDLFYGFTQYGGLLNISTSAGGSLNSQVRAPTAETGTNDSGGNWITPLTMNNEGELYAGYSKVYKFVSGSWAEVTTNSFISDIDFLEIDDLNPDNMYVAIGGTLFKSTDRGVTFSQIKTFFPRAITSIEVNTSDSDIIYVTTSGTGGGVHKSTDGGSTFTNITGSLPNVTKNIIKHQDQHPDNPLFLGTSLGVYRYDDTLADWEIFNINLPNVSVTDIEITINENIITAATYGRGIWQSSIPIQLASNDIKFLSIQQIVGTDCNNSIQILVENNGLNTINNVTVTYTVNGIDNNFNWSGTILPQATALIDIPTLSSGIHEFTSSVTIVNDAYVSNNDSDETAVIYVNTSGTPETVNTFDSRNPTDDLAVYGAGTSAQYWERGIPGGTVLNSAWSGAQAYGTNLNGNYDNNILSYLVTECYDLSILSDPIIKFYMTFDLEENWDVMYVEYSIDNGSNWSVLGTKDINWYNSDRTNATSGFDDDCLNCPGAQWTGTNATFQEYSYSLTNLNSETNITFRFVFHTDVAVVKEGVIIDDLVIDGTLLGIDDFNAENFRIYPNPSNNIFNIKIRNVNTFNIDIYDVTGKLMVQKKNVNTNNNIYPLDMSSFSSGIYFLNISTDSSKVTKKLILN